MIEHLRRVALEAELPEHLAVEVEQARQRGDTESLDEAIQGALTAWSYERWQVEDPEGWARHVAEIHRRIDELDAHPERAIPLEVVIAELEAEFGLPDADRAA